MFGLASMRFAIDISDIEPLALYSKRANQSSTVDVTAEITIEF
jgi:hypothetical protein